MAFVDIKEEIIYEIIYFTNTIRKHATKNSNLKQNNIISCNNSKLNKY